MGTFFAEVQLASSALPNRRETIKLLVDSGSMYTWVSASVLRELGVQPTERRRLLTIEGRTTEREAAYVWAAQVAAARRNGLADDVIDLLRAKGDAGKLGDDEREIVTYVRQLMRTNKVDQKAFDALKSRHNEQWMVEVTAAASYFAFLSGVVNAFEVAAPPDGDKLPA